MSTDKAIRLSKAAKEFNVGISTIVEYLKKKGHEIENNPNTKITPEIYNVLIKEYMSDISVKKKSEQISMKSNERKETISIDDVSSVKNEFDDEDSHDQFIIKDSSVVAKEIIKETPKIVGKIDLSTTEKKKKPVEPVKPVEIEVPVSLPEPEIVEEVVEEEKEIIKEEIKPETIDHLKVVGKIDLDAMNQKTRPSRKTKEEKEAQKQEKADVKKASRKKDSKPTEEISELDEINENDNIADVVSDEIETNVKEGVKIFRSEFDKLTGPTVVGKIILPVDKDKSKKLPVASSNDSDQFKKKKKRKRIRKNVPSDSAVQSDEAKKKKFQKIGNKKFKKEVDEEDVQKQIKETLEKLTSKTKSKSAKHRRDKRDSDREKVAAEVERQEHEKTILKVTEFVSVNEIATMMDVPANEVIATCMNLGLFVSINQRLDAETMALLAEEFGFTIQFVSIDVQNTIAEEEDKEEDLESRYPIVTVMGHVDHGKTKLLDFIRSSNVVSGEAGGITQHIGAYSVILEDGRKITFLDTPGHEAFTAMRARGAQITDIVIIVVAADDGVMPQTIEAINHASAAGVPMVFAINKIDKPAANPEKIKEALANMNYLVEDWGGKYQSQEISAKQGINIDELLEKVLLEAEMLELKANPNKKAYGTVIESSLDKGRGYVATILVESGTLHSGDIMLAGCYHGHIKAMYNERGAKILEAGPATPVVILGLNGAPQAGDKFNILDTDTEAKSVANKRLQLIREQGLRTQKHITLDEIGRRIAIGNFQELNIIVKGDVDGSIEALSDSLIKLANEEIQVNIIHKAVGQISESDVMLATASNAIIVGFQVRPSVSARKLAEKEQIDIRLYSIIYDAINEIKDAMEGMLSPEMKEEITSTVEVREVFKITKVGSVAGCMVVDGKINRNSKIRIIRDGIVIYSGVLGSLKRFKDDVKEVSNGYECGLNVDKYNDIKIGDLIESYEEKEVKKKL
ncbi:MAG: translation initiation factor IF-2 [Bacteroidota bacterium]